MSSLASLPNVSELIPFNATRDSYKTLSLLSILTSDGPVYFIVGGVSKPCSNLELQQGSSYYYNEGSCPTNYVPVACISFKGDHDPHGIFQHVRTVWETKEDNFEKIFPEMVGVDLECTCGHLYSKHNEGLDCFPNGPCECECFQPKVESGAE